MKTETKCFPNEGFDYLVTLTQDINPLNPLEEDDEFKLFVVPNRYFRGSDAYDKERIDELLSEYPHASIFPVEAYVHGDISLSVNRGGALADKWDSAICGVGILLYDKPVDPMLAVDIMNGRLESFSNYLNGEIYSACLWDEEGDSIDAMGGFEDVTEALIRECFSDHLGDEAIRFEMTYVDDNFHPLYSVKCLNS